jgi:AcrR family transcriptional regulator
VLDVAAALLDEVGFEAATTNAIAARAGMSPGSLYQFFANKDAIVEALVARYIERLRATQAVALAPESATLPLDVLLDRVVDPLVAFELDQPGFRIMLTGGDVSARCAVHAEGLNQAVLSQVETMLVARVPDMRPEQRSLCARVSVGVFKGILPLAVAAAPADRAAIVAELKRALYCYLAPRVGEEGTP